MRSLAVFVAAAALWLAPGAAAATVTVQPSADVGLPFWCDWRYDWEERCYADHGPRLPVGGVDDKVWRSALRFPLGGIPAGASITSAELRVRHDGTCVAPRLRSVACEPGSYWIDAHAILTADWFDEREPALDERVAARSILWDASAPQTLRFDLTGLVRDWHSRLVRNDGVLLQLTDWQEGYGVSGPYFPSSSFGDVSVRPVLVVAYMPADL
jgi:hypothetical protein